MKKYSHSIFKNDAVFDRLESYITNSALKWKESYYPFFKDDKFCLYHGDCLTILSHFPTEYVDMIFADPPYMLSNNGFTCHAGRMVSVNKGEWDTSKGFEEDLKFHEAWLSECKRVLKPNGTIWVSGTYHNIFQCGSLMQKIGFHILNDIIWFKPNASPNLSCRFFTASHESIIWARKDKKGKHVFNYKAMKDGIFNNDFLKKPGKQMRSVWSINPPKPYEKKFGKHPTQKPLELLKRVVLSSTNKGDIVLDPFSGSGTTGIASIIAGERKFIGIEYELNYLETAIKRYKELSNDIDETKLQFVSKE